MATLLHHIFQRMGIPPDEVMAKPPGVRAFMLASMRVQLEEENNSETDE
jgi:uncharacterized protein YbaP (TraB family)